MSDSQNSSGSEEKKTDADDVNRTSESENENETKPVTPEKKASPKKEKASPKKPAKKEEVKSENEDDDEEEDDEEDDEDEGGDKKVGLLDQPLEVTGARERKKVERLEMTYNVLAKEKKPDIPEGSGEKLGDCPRIEFQIQKTKADDLKNLHRILFNRPGTATEIKRNIRKFNGFSFRKNTPEYAKKKGHLDKLMTVGLKQMCTVIDLERSGTKEEIVTRILDFLVKPKASGKAVPKSKKKSSKSDKKKPSKSNAKSKSTKKRKGKAADSESEEEEMDNDVSESEGSEKEEKNASDEDEDEEEEELKKKATKVTNSSKDNKKSGNAAAKKDKKDSTKAEKEEKKPVKTKKRKVISSDEDNSSDDEPLVKKAKQPPTDDELKSLVKSILDGANLEEITMKTVCKQVFAHYPEFDLADKKEFIKTTVRSIIS